MIHRFAGVAALVLLAGCGGRAPEAERNVTTVNTETAAVVQGNATGNVSGEAKPAFALADDGFWITLADGRTQRAGFGAPRDLAVEILEGALDAPVEQGSNPECGAGPLDNVNFKGGLVLFFQNGKFVGWNIDSRDNSPYKTSKGIGLGSTLQQLRDAGDVMVQETSLGTEFTAGELSGLLTKNVPEATITALWAGTTCAFR